MCMGHDNNLQNLNGRKALVTGGANGIGREICLQLAQRGAGVVFGYRSDDKAAASLMEKIAESGGQAVSLRCDLTIEADANKLVALAAEKLSGIDIVVNTVGDIFSGKLEQTRSDDLISQFESNLLTMFNCTQAAIVHLRKSEHGRIISFGIVSAFEHWPRKKFAVHAALKSAVINLTRSYADSEAEFGTCAVSISPGFIDTGSQPATDLIERLQNKLPLGRAGTVQEVAELVAYLCSDSGSYLSGIDLEIAGAWKP
jgi:3-oxoacyl-[acyl-carrier protein] reductase